jgi:hypothetical protein
LQQRRHWTVIGEEHGVPYDTLQMALLADQKGNTHGIARPGA